jgi:hypothetical protein
MYLVLTIFTTTGIAAALQFIRLHVVKMLVCSALLSIVGPTFDILTHRLQCAGYRSSHGQSGWQQRCHCSHWMSSDWYPNPDVLSRSLTQPSP